MHSIHPEVRLYLDRVIATLRDHLGVELIGSYLHGSLAMGAFHAGRSDIDILAVCAAPLRRERRMGLGEALARGRALIGPEPGELFPEPDRASLIRAFLSDLRTAEEGGAAWWEGHETPELASMAYLVLNAARSWWYLETGELGSKGDGASWLERRDPDPDTRVLLDAALAYQRGGTPDRPDERTVHAFVDRVEAMLRSAIA